MAALLFSSPGNFLIKLLTLYTIQIYLSARLTDVKLYLHTALAGAVKNRFLRFGASSKGISTAGYKLSKASWKT
jgi:hypothetical protein